MRPVHFETVSVGSAAEVYPAPIRGTAHGVSAAIGKLGALAPTILYNYVDNQTKFWVRWVSVLFVLVGFLHPVLSHACISIQESLYHKCHTHLFACHIITVKCRVRVMGLELN